MPSVTVVELFGTARGSSSADEQVAKSFETLLRRGYPEGSLQDRLAQALEWLEGQLLTPHMLAGIEARARATLREYLAEGHFPRLAMRCSELAQELVVTHDERGNITIELPAEVRACLQERTPSMISF